MGGIKGRKCTPETIEKMKKIKRFATAGSFKKGHKHSEETKRKIILKNIGRKQMHKLICSPWFLINSRYPKRYEKYMKKGEIGANVYSKVRYVLKASEVEIK